MKTNRYFLLFPLLAALLGSCKEETLDVYHGSDYMHFTPISESAGARSELNFATYKTTDATSALVPVSLTLWGYLPTQDIPYRVSVVADKTTAVADTDFKRPAGGVFRAGKAVDTLWVRVYRKEELLATDYTITLQLDGADNCAIGPKGYSTVTLAVTDRITQPNWWAQSVAARLGVFSAMKYRVFNIYLGRVLANLDGYTGITFGAEITAFKVWWQARWAEGLYRYYDTDGTTPLYETIAD